MPTATVRSAAAQRHLHVVLPCLAVDVAQRESALELHAGAERLAVGLAHAALAVAPLPFLAWAVQLLDLVAPGQLRHHEHVDRRKGAFAA